MSSLPARSDLPNCASPETPLLSYGVAENNRSNPEATAPLSFAQESLWFLEQLCPNRPAYNVPQVFRIFGQLDVSALEQALQAVIGRHQALRTNIVIHDQQPRQVLRSVDECSLTKTDLSCLDPVAREIQLQRLLEE